MVAEREIIGLKKAYALLQSLEIAREYGPLRGYTEYDRVQRLWRETIDSAVKVVQRSSCKDGEGSYVVDAPSPWHAYFYLRAQQQYVYRAGRLLESANNQANSKFGDHLFFRGQRCANWEFKSSLQRKDAVSQATEQRAVTALAEYFKHMFALNDDIAINSARCFAQHYGIATDLLDVTCDPDIAVWFATHPVSETCPLGDGSGIIHAASWAGQEGHAEIIFLLPPPFVSNVYRQRGLFIDTSNTNGRLTGKLSLQIRFPRETAGGEFFVIRKGTPLEVWPQADNLEEELVAWARDIGAACKDTDAVCSRFAEDYNENSLPKFWLRRELYDFEKHVQPWCSILDWVIPATCVTALPDASGGLRYEVNSAKVRALVSANPTFFRAFIDSTEGASFSGLEAIEQVLTLARSQLGEAE